MAIRTFYWNKRHASIYKYYKNKIFNPDRIYLKHGNAGDIFNIDLIRYLYNQEPENILNNGKRLLLVGSIMNIVKEGDIINGIGWKGNDMGDMSSVLSKLKIYGVRGPLTKSLFEKYDADLSDLKFELDPGLLIKEVYDINLKKSKEKDVIFIPHFRDQKVRKGNFPKGIKVVNIDMHPKKLAKEILNAKVVYSSSLHGIIFSHALNKPCVFVKPQTNEPIFKYRDYYLSIGQELPEAINDIDSINFFTDKPSLLSRTIGIDDFYFPSLNELDQYGIVK